MYYFELRGDSDLRYVLAAEIEDINRRRKAKGRPEHTFEIGIDDDRQVLDMAGLALSGGGIRSASFCLGVLQALNRCGAIERIDYLSTVSGGGYIGSSLSATMTATGGRFPFGAGPSPQGAPPVQEISDTPAVSHIRNYSNYLIPFGARDALTATGIVLRGLAANTGAVFALILLTAALTAWLMPERTLAAADTWLPAGPFGATARLLLFLPLLFFAWALHRSLLNAGKLAEFRTRLPRIAAAALVVLAGVAFVELQPFVIDGMFGVADAQMIAAATDKPVDTSGLFFGLVLSWAQALAAVATPVAAVVTLFRKSFADIISAAGTTARMTTKLAGVLASAAVWVAGAALPLLVWIGYLYLAYWAVADYTTLRVPAVTCASDAASGSFSLGEGGPSGRFDGRLALDRSAPCTPSPPRDVVHDGYGHAPAWIRSAGAWLHANVRVNGKPLPASPLSLYVVLGVPLLLFALFLKPNANSLHRLYRDRLSKAFLFNPDGTPEAGETAGRRDPPPLDGMRLTDIDPAQTPYQLINAALNIQGSDFTNRRGRNADFFLFSRRYVGGPATGYAETKQMQKVAPDLNLATALAISGAAASSNMGSKSVKALTPTLALLNVRLGFWLPNPYFAYRNEPEETNANLARPRRVWSYLVAEIAGRLNEDSTLAYLTDGGHIENLGIYELLRRRCRLIVAVDAEADPEMRFTSFVTLQRYARIDLGIRIRLPFEALAATSRAWMGVGGRDRPPSDLPAAHGPHIAVGTIDYGSGRTGYLVYLKASLTGDENDYIRDYARRHAAFPHETTGDQFFNEEQFEVYRALGFHAMSRFLAAKPSETDDVVADRSLVDRPPSPSPPPGGTTWPLGAAPGTPQPPDPPRSLAGDGVIVRADHPGLAEIRGMLA